MIKIQDMHPAIRTITKINNDMMLVAYADSRSYGCSNTDIDCKFAHSGNCSLRFTLEFRKTILKKIWPDECLLYFHSDREAYAKNCIENILEVK